MSRESSEWLNNNCLIGYTDERGHAWHYRVENQGAEPNHYPGAIPFDDVLRRLFNFEVVERALWVEDSSGNPRTRVTDRKAMVCSDNGDVLGIFKSGYQGHQYQEWLMENVGTVLDDDIGIGSAGLLRNRAQAFVSIEVPENIITPEGVEFRPNLLACTSFDGSLATTYKRVNTRVVCDNTNEAALSEEGQMFKTKHTRFSGFRINDAREALHIVHTMADDFSREIAELCAWKVSDAEFAAHLAITVPEPDENGSKAASTRWDNKRSEIISLYRADARVAPWNGTAFGVLQAHNTWNQHYATVRKGVARASRNMENVLNGKMGNQDHHVLTVLRDVTGIAA